MQLGLFNERKEIQLRPYQEEALASIPEAGAFIICLATGLGKTICMSRIQRRGRMLILSHRDELVHQPEKYFDCSFGVEQGNETSHGEEVVSASVQSLVRRLHKFQPDDFDVLVTDECFPAGTLVGRVRIEDIQKGDYVTAYNHQERQIEKRKVLRIMKRPAPPMMLQIGGHFACTPNHPIYDVDQRKYVRAEELSRLNACLLEITGGAVHAGVIQKVSSEKVCSDGYVYNLEVEGLNNYFANGILVHNCHHSTAPTYRKIYDYFKPRLHLGFTATPNRNDGVGLKAVYDDIIFERNLKWGIENGYLSNIHCLRVNIGVDLHQVAQRLGDYAPESLEKAVNIERANEAVAEAYKLYAKPPVLIFCASVEHAEALAKKIPGAVSVKGGEDRSETVQAFSEGKIPCLTNCMVFTEGTDLPNVTRLYPGKEYLTLIDCVGAGDNVDLCTAPSLLGLDIDDVPPKQRYKLQGNLFDIPEIITELEDTPQAWITNVRRVDLWARNNSYNLHGVNFFRMPNGSMILSTPRMVIPPEDSLGRIMWNGRLEPAQKVFDAVYNDLQQNYSDNRALWDLSIAQRWGNVPATEKQKALIQRHFPTLDVAKLTKLEAGQVLTRYFNEPATPKQIYLLKRHGYDVEGLSKYDAMKMIKELKGA